VKMMDFGIARFDTSTLTQQGSVIGTPRYMSPEQILGKPVDARGDLFSSGVVLHEMLSGTPPFDGGSMSETIHKILSMEPPDLTSFDNTISPGIAAVVRKALAKEPAERFPNARTMAAALRSGTSVDYDDSTAVIRHGFNDPPAAGASPPGPGPASVSQRSISQSFLGHSAVAPPSLTSRSGTGLSAEEIVRAERALALALGPIAKIMVKRALPNAHTADELWQALSALIPSDGERAQFLKQRGARRI
jgi:eukaryotic-like serine/threonine-protein kinase